MASEFQEEGLLPEPTLEDYQTQMMVLEQENAAKASPATTGTTQSSTLGDYQSSSNRVLNISRQLGRVESTA